jgi:hypothetical protein
MGGAGDKRIPTNIRGWAAPDGSQGRGGVAGERARQREAEVSTRCPPGVRLNAARKGRACRARGRHTRAFLGALWLWCSAVHARERAKGTEMQRGVESEQRAHADVATIG